jgi:hypothetical protein
MVTPGSVCTESGGMGSCLRVNKGTIHRLLCQFHDIIPVEKCWSLSAHRTAPSSLQLIQSPPTSHWAVGGTSPDLRWGVLWVSISNRRYYFPRCLFRRRKNKTWWYSFLTSSNVQTRWKPALFGTCLWVFPSVQWILNNDASKTIIDYKGSGEHTFEVLKFHCCRRFWQF